MILIFCAFGAEAYAIRGRLSNLAALNHRLLNGYSGRIADVPVALVSTGIGIRRSRSSAARAMDSLQSIDLVIISGVAGGLRSDLSVGRVVLGEQLFTCREEDFQPEQMVQVPSQWIGRFAAELSAAHIPYEVGAMMTSRRPLMTGADKRRANLESGAIAVDMESAVIGLEAQRRGLPFVCMRTVLDTVDEDVAGAGLADQNGRIRKLAAARALITNPRMIVGVARLLRNLRLATRALASALETTVPHVP